MPQYMISICTSCSVGSRRVIVVDFSADVALPAEYAFALYMDFDFPFNVRPFFLGPRDSHRQAEIITAVQGKSRDLQSSLMADSSL